MPRTPQSRQFEHFRRHPERFELRPSWPRTLLFGGLVLALAAAIVATIANYAALVEFLDAAKPRRGRAGVPGVLAAPMTLAVELLFGAIAVHLLRRYSNRVVHRATGRTLRRRHRRRVDLPVHYAAALHAAISSGDPRRWLPLPRRSDRGEVEVDLLELPGEPVVWVAISAGRAGHERPLPLIDLAGPAASAIAATGRFGYGRPASPAAIAAFEGRDGAPPHP